MCIVGLHRTPWKISGTIAFNSVILLLHCATKIVFQRKASLLLYLFAYLCLLLLTLEKINCLLILVDVVFYCFGLFCEVYIFMMYCFLLKECERLVHCDSFSIHHYRKTIKEERTSWRESPCEYLTNWPTVNLNFIANSSFYHLMLVFSRLVSVWLYLYYVNFMEPLLRKRCYLLLREWISLTYIK